MAEESTGRHQHGRHAGGERDERTARVAGDIEEAGRAARDVAAAAATDGRGAATARAAEQAERLQAKALDAAEQLRKMSPEDAQQLLRSGLDWARKQPAYALGGALAVGFLTGKAWGRLTARKG